MHRSRLCAVLIDCKTSDVDEAARFWGEALGRPVDTNHPSSRSNYRILGTPLDEPIVEIQSVDHESRVHIDIATDDIPAEVERLEKLGAKVVNRPDHWVVMQAPTGQRFCVVRVQRPGSRRTLTAGTKNPLRDLRNSCWRPLRSRWGPNLPVYCGPILALIERLMLR
jgi:predicted enzyme related to lactoylglutathione lyase